MINIIKKIKDLIFCNNNLHPIFYNEKCNYTLVQYLHDILIILNNLLFLHFGNLIILLMPI